MGPRGAPATGSLLAGRYRLAEPLRRAGGAVWLAHDEVGDRPVTVEQLYEPAGERSSAVRSQAGAVARLSHPGLARVLDLVEQDGRPWLVTEYLAAPTLEQVLSTSGPLTEPEAARIGLQVLEALGVALAGGVEERDVRPSTVLVADGGQVVLTGVGVPRHRDEPPGDAGPVDPYQPPEPVHGARAEGLRSDLWSLGATLYAAVHGRAPDRSQGWRQVAPTALGAVLAGLLAPDPGRRLSADEAERLLREIAGYGPDEEVEYAPAVGRDPPPPAAPEVDGDQDEELAAALAALEAALKEIELDAPAGHAGTAAPDAREEVQPAAAMTEGAPAAKAPAAAPARAPDVPAQRDHPPASAGQHAPVPKQQARPAPGGAGGAASGQLGPGGAAGQGGSVGTPEYGGAGGSGGSSRGRMATVGPAGREPGSAAVLTGPAGVHLPHRSAQRPAPQRPPAAEPRWSRRSLLLALVVVALAAATGGLLTLMAGGDDTAAPTATANAGLTDSAGSTGNGAVPPALDTPSPPPAAPVPAGWRLHRDPSGFSVGVPDDWQQGKEGTAVTFRDPRTDRLIRIDQRPDPGLDPYEDWIRQERTVAGRTAGYDLIRIARVIYRGWPSADWEYRAGRNSDPVHVLVRGVVPAGTRAYAIHWSTSDSRWTADRKYFDTVVGTFSPAR